MSAVLLSKKDACLHLFGAASSYRYRQLEDLAASGEIKMVGDRWVPFSEIRRLAGDRDE
jgi:hypothetical protein